MLLEYITLEEQIEKIQKEFNEQYLKFVERHLNGIQKYENSELITEEDDADDGSYVCLDERNKLHELELRLIMKRVELSAMTPKALTNQLRVPNFVDRKKVYRQAKLEKKCKLLLEEKKRTQHLIDLDIEQLEKCKCYIKQKKHRLESENKI